MRGTAWVLFAAVTITASSVGAQDAEPALPDLPPLPADDAPAVDEVGREPPAVDEPTVSLDDLLRIEISSAAKVKQSVSEAPSAIAVFSRDQVRAYGWSSLNDILYRQPGFAPARDYERRTVAARGGFEGWNNNHLLLLVDGIPFNDALYGSAYTWEITPLAIANTIEVSRGPGSALYGSNATNGVIAITTVSPAHLGTVGEARFRVGSDGTQIHDFVVADTWRRLAITLGYDYFTSDGNQYASLDGSGRTDGSGAPLAMRVRDQRDSSYFFAKLEGRGALKGLSVQFHNQAWSFETGHGWLWWIPDQRESMDEARQIVSVAYHHESDRLEQEYAVRYQRHGIDWNMRYLGNGSFDGLYPEGVSEYLNTSAHELFARAQVTRGFGAEGSALAGVEYTGFLYTGDDAHYANAALGDADGPPTEGMQPLGPWFEWIQDRPVNNVGVYGQVVSGGFLRRRVNLTAGVRYDVQHFRYRDISDPMSRSDVSKTFQQVSPRAGLVITATPRLVVKVLGGRAFRAPAPAELFGANSWTLASNIKGLKPETIDSAELASELRLGSAVVLRGNGYYQRFANQIAYSEANYNLSTNIYSHDVVGAEAEVAVGTRLTATATLGGFANYSAVRLVRERVTDSPITENRNLTWAPSQWANAGVDLRVGDWQATSQAHVQGPVRRRASDRADAANVPYRPDRVAAWATLDARVTYRPQPWIELGLQAQNLTGSRGELIKNNDYPFDYRIEPRLVLAVVDVQVR